MRTARLLGLMVLFGAALLTRVTQAGRLFVIDWAVVCALTVVLARWGRPYLPTGLRWAAQALTVLVVMDSLTRAGRAGIVNPNLLGSALVLVGPWAWQWVVVGIMATQSRGAMLAGWAALGVWRQWWHKPIALVTTAVLVLVLVFARPATITARVSVWQEAAALFVMRPFDGWGVGSYAALARVEPGKIHADSALLTLAVEGGLVTVVAFVVMVVEVARLARKARPEVWWALLAFGLHQLVDFTLFSPLVALPFAATLAMLEDVWTPEPLQTV